MSRSFLGKAASQKMHARVLIAAALPALLGSVLLMSHAAAPFSLWVQQVVVALAAAMATQVALRYGKGRTGATPGAAAGFLLGLAALVWVPVVVAGSTTPHRWIGLFGFRLYIAPVVLPLFLLLWHRALSSGKATANGSTAAAAVTGVGLFLQPDAAQLTAFAIASMAVLLRPAEGGRFIKLVMPAALLVAAAVSWARPDPLAPVPYVEGVFMLAASHSAWALGLAVIAASLPVVALAWLAQRLKSPGLLAASLYFACLYLLAPIQVTPVPLLGFGAGPILGYFILASQVRARKTPAAGLPSAV